MARSLGLDIGDKRIGLAISDPGGMLASPLSIIERGDLDTDIQRIVGIIRQYQVEQVIVGLPLSLDGSLGTQAEKVQDFARGLAQATEVPVRFRDERLTTVAARRLMSTVSSKRAKKAKKTTRDDAIAAALILQSFLDEVGGEQ